MKGSSRSSTVGSAEKDKQILIRHLQSSTETVLKMYDLIKAEPQMLPITNILDYVKNLDQMLTGFLQAIPKKCVPMQLHKNLEAKQAELEQNVKKLEEQQKSYKIEIKVMEDKIEMLVRKLQQASSPRAAHRYSNDSHRQGSSPMITKQLKYSQKSHMGEESNARFDRKKRLSLPSLQTESVRRKKASSRTNFVENPGEGNQKLIQHLMSKIMLN